MISILSRKALAKPPLLRGVVTDDLLADLRARNEKRRKDALAELGTHWMAHPGNHVRRLDEPKVPAALLFSGDALNRLMRDLWRGARIAR